jgi:hypothetical protein
MSGMSCFPGTPMQATKDGKAGKVLFLYFKWLYLIKKPGMGKR